MKLRYNTQDLKKYIELVENYNNDSFKILLKDLQDYKIIYAILRNRVLGKVEAKKAKTAIEIAEKNIFINYFNEPRREANNFISKKYIRNKVFSIHGKFCLCCGSIYKLSLDHIIPVSKGGINSIDNLQPLCKNCNSKKGSKVIDFRKPCHITKKNP